MFNWLIKLICPANDDNEKITALKDEVFEAEIKINELQDQLNECMDIKDASISVYSEYKDILGAYFCKFEDKRQITRKECMTAFKPLILTDTIQAFADNLYKTVSKSDMEKFLVKDKTSLRKYYVTEFFDCDDFAFRLKGNITTQNNADIAFFIVWTSTHAFNAFIDHNHKVWFIEPQTDEILDPVDTHHHYYNGLAVIIG